jgi:hypothetical protein
MLFRNRFKLKPIKPMGVSINDSLLKRILRGIGTVLLMFLFSAFTTLLVVEWLVGCGETYVDAKGERHAYECLFIPLNRN